MRTPVLALVPCCGCFFFFNDTATTEIYTLSLHDALPIFPFRVGDVLGGADRREAARVVDEHVHAPPRDRKSTRLNSSHQIISYAVFCLKKKKSYDEFPFHSLHTFFRRPHDIPADASSGCH